MSPLFVFPVWLNLDFIEVTKVGGKCSFQLKAIPDKSGSVLCKGQQKNISLSTLPCVSEIKHKTAKKLCKGKLFQLVSQGISLKEIIFAFSSEHLKINLDVRNLVKYRYRSHIKTKYIKI